MRNISEYEINSKLKSGIDELYNDSAQRLWDIPIDKAEVYDLIYKKKKRLALKLLIPIAASLVILVGIFTVIQSRFEATVYLDVNPSIELKTNSFDKIIDVKADNKDGKTVLDDMNLYNTDIDVGVNAVVGAMIKHGYLDKAKRFILLSVDSDNKERADNLKKRLSVDLNKTLTKTIGSGSVLEQNVEDNADVEKLAEKYRITYGKAYLIQKIIELNPKISFSTLANKNIRDMIVYLKQQNVDIRKIIEYNGDDLDDIMEDANERYYGDDLDGDDDKEPSSKSNKSSIVKSRDDDSDDFDDDDSDDDDDDDDDDDRNDVDDGGDIDDD